ncbi:ATP-binding protein [Nocardiopsis composta]|nr:ATP-binding protein [Nocardiopsis composta]
MSAKPRSSFSSHPFHSTRWEPRIYPGRLSQASRVRAHIRRDLAGFPDDTVDTVQLCCSELFANAVAYTASGEEGGEVVRRMSLHRPDALRLEVTDGGWTDRRPAVPGDRSDHDWAEAEGQRGLLLLSACAAAWGYFQVLPHSTLNLGLRVWADFPIGPGGVPAGLEHYVFAR